jgi:hypothetical protein
MIRPYEPEDLPQLMELHAKFHPGTVFPDPENAQNKLCLVDETDGVIAGAVIVRATVEFVGIGNRTLGSPTDRLHVIQGLIGSASMAVYQMGIHEAHIPIQPADHRYGDRLVQMGLLADRRLWYTLDCHDFYNYCRQADHQEDPQ